MVNIVTCYHSGTRGTFLTRSAFCSELQTLSSGFSREQRNTPQNTDTVALPLHEDAWEVTSAADGGEGQLLVGPGGWVSVGNTGRSPP
jgi:hypothetical protein